ncbi:MAG: glycosyltransferase family 1 protein [Bdellovibrionota bacterium]|nr:MAG: glycosyltransferase family 1 protein [Bdellovibrionota bacterium]
MSELDNIIAPEIKNDAFYSAIVRLAREEKLTNVLEIGSSAGGGSTEAFVNGLKDNPHHPRLFCLEVSRVRFQELKNRYAQYPFVHCYNASSVPLSAFPSAEAVAQFYRCTHSKLNQYPLQEVLRWLEQDRRYIQSEPVPQDGIARIMREHSITHFDMVLIDGSEFLGRAEFELIKGARIILLDDICTYKNHEVHQLLLADDQYELIEEDQFTRNGYSIFRRKQPAIAASQSAAEEVVAAVQQWPATALTMQAIKNHRQPKPAAPHKLPIHFFTIVLNGEPFIRHHIEQFKKLSGPWHWHIVEGLAAHAHDTAWSLENGGRIDSSLHDQARSNDGTSGYLDELARQYPQQVTVYRKAPGELWDGKLEMVRAPLPNIRSTALLWQVDSDELWTTDQIERMEQLFREQPTKTAAWFWCWYYVGPELVVGTRLGYAENPNQEWLRVWRYSPGMQWVAHEPPILATRDESGRYLDVGRINPFVHDEMERHGLVFQHPSYVNESQLRFKELYYGYKDAVKHWRRLQEQSYFPQKLREYFPWVKDDTMVVKAASMGLPPIFSAGSPTGIPAPATSPAQVTVSAFRPRIAIDGVFFQYKRTGIARLWSNYLQQWAAAQCASDILLLDRGGSCPKFDNIKSISVPLYDGARGDEDKRFLEQLLQAQGCSLFVSTYYTSPLNTPSVQMVYDLIPEALKWDMQSASDWRDKQHAIRRAQGFICISQHTLHDLMRFYPEVQGRAAIVAYPAVSSAEFSPASASEVDRFLKSHRIEHPYFLMVGPDVGYKNAEMFFEAFHSLPCKDGFEVALVGGHLHDHALSILKGQARVRRVQWDDKELRLAYSGAAALVYPSRYEGFGLPLLEAMACDCPVITTPFTSIPEVAGEAALFVTSAAELADALCEVQKPAIRNELKRRGSEQLKKFSWSSSAQQITSFLRGFLPQTNLVQLDEHPVQNSFEAAARPQA